MYIYMHYVCTYIPVYTQKETEGRPERDKQRGREAQRRKRRQAETTIGGETGDTARRQPMETL